MKKNRYFRLVVLTLLAGCNDPVHHQHLAHRQDNLRNTAQVFVDNEAPRMDNLGRTLVILRGQYDRDVENSRRNPKIVRDWVENDIKRWNEQQPEIRKGINDQLKGNPENIKRTVPDILY